MGDWSHSILKDEETTRDFAHHLGYAILNCGTLENLTYSYAATLEGNHFFGTGLNNKTFPERKRAIIDFLEQADIAQDTRERAIDLWNETIEIMPVRNIVAHNPINRVEIRDEQHGLKKLIGVVDMAQSTSSNVVSLDAAKLSNLANRASALADNLASCLNTIALEMKDD